ncbi:MAG: hypothetical protein L3J08_09040 [Flavobacteriaceae bacterium]|nr:hypothetical protein [Flavobacteriaceae bacterium]
MTSKHRLIYKYKKIFITACLYHYKK